MRRRPWGAAVLLVAAMLVPAAAGAQSAPAVPIQVPAEGVTQEIRLRDGTSAYGRVEAVADERVRFRTLAGATLDIAVADVAALTTAEGRVVGNEFWRADPNPTRLFFGPTGRALPRGDAYLGVYEIYLPFVQVGVTDRISIGGGTPLVFVNDEDQRPFWITPKITVVEQDRTSVALGVMHVTGFDEVDFGIGYGVATVGTRDSAITVGAGFAYTDDNDDLGEAPVVMIGGEHRVHRSLKLISENYVFRDGGLASAGIRFISGRLSADLGLVTPLGIDEFVLFPVVNFVWNFR
jgi:hypothetical protein